MYKLNKNEKILYYSCFFLVLFLFLSVFILSSFKIVNAWSFSQAHTNYFDGYVRRGFFGTFMLWLEGYLNIPSKKTFSIFFIILTSLNITLFFQLIKKYIGNTPLFIFLALNPTLILFSFNDLGGYQRFDSISVFLILYHSLIAHKYYNKEIKIQEYKNKLFSIIFLIALISLFIHEIQSWSLLFHSVITLNIIKNYRKTFFYYSIFLLPVLFIFLFPVNEENIVKMINNFNNKNLYLDAIQFASSVKNNLNVIDYEFKTNVLNIYNFKINLFFILMSTLPYYLILIFLKNNNYLEKQKLNLKYLIISQLPFLSLFIIGDTGRWINLISFVSLGYLAQFKITKRLQNYKLRNIKFTNFFLYFFILIMLFIYSFFVRMPHCCNLQAKQINIWGGISSKLIAYIKIIKKDPHPNFNLDLRFKQ